MPLLEARALGVRRGGRWVLRDVSLALEAGEALGVVGPSGVGKTTLLRALLGLLTPDEGEVLLEGQAWSKAPERVRRPRRPRIQAVFQDLTTSLPPHLTGWELLAEPLRIHRRGDPSTWRDAAARMAARVAFPEASLHQRPGSWSRGLAQRLALGRALMLSPRILLLDEPFSALDATLAQHLMALLLQLREEGLGLLLVSHQHVAVKTLCHRVMAVSPRDAGCAVGFGDHR